MPIKPSSKHDLGSASRKKSFSEPTAHLINVVGEEVAHDIAETRYPGDNVSVRDLLIPYQAQRITAASITGRNADPTPVHHLGDAKYNDFVCAVVDRLLNDEELASSFDPETGLTGENGIPSSFGPALTDMSTFMDPQGYDQTDNTPLRNDRGLVEVSRRNIQIADDFLAVVFERRIPVTQRYKKGSSAGAPTMERSKDRKRYLIAASLNNEVKIEELTRLGKAEELARKYMVAPLIIAGYRAQHEKADKKRAVSCPLLNYGYDDPSYPEYANKSGARDPRMHSARLRIVRGVPMGYNITIGKYLLQYVEYFSVKYAATVKNVTPEVQAAKLDRLASYYSNGKLAAGDMVTYDATFPEVLHERIEAFFSNKISAEFASLLKLSRSLPTYQPSAPADYELYGITGFLSGSIRNLKPRGALVSGHVCTSVYGKLGTLINHFCILSEMGIPVTPDFIRKTLEHDPSIADQTIYMLNGGDDHLLYGDSGMIERYFDVASKSGSLFFRVEREESSLYLGTVYTRTNTGKFVGYPNMVTFVTKLLAPERAWNHSSKTNWEIGLKARYSHYRSAPMFSRISKIIDEEHEKRYGYTMSAYVASLPGLLSDINSLFLADPDIVYYKVDPNAIDSEIFDMVYDTIPPEACQFSWPLQDDALPDETVLELKESFSATYVKSNISLMELFE